MKFFFILLPFWALSWTIASAQPMHSRAYRLSGTTSSSAVSDSTCSECPATDENIRPDKPMQVVNAAQVARFIQYPRKARRQGIEGTVEVRILVNEAGCYLRHQIKGSPNAMLLAAVEPYVHLLRFDPPTHDGLPTKLWVTVPFAFKLGNDAETVADTTDRPASSEPVQPEQLDGQRSPTRRE